MAQQHIRHNDIVENYKELQKTHPSLTFEYGLENFLILWTLHDYAMFVVMEKEVGTDRAANLYADVWRLRSRLEWPDLCALIGRKPEDKFTIDDIAKIMIEGFALFGNTMELVERTEDRVTLRNYDCPYITQVIWKYLSPEEALALNHKIQLQCNHALFETYLELAGLYDEWLFNFPAQLCMNNQYCEFTFTKVKLDK